MYWRYRWTDLWLSLGWELAHWRRRFALFWYGGNKAPWLFVFVAGLVVAGLAFALYSAIAYQDERRKRVREFHKQSLTCLALNVYFEARGEHQPGDENEQPRRLVAAVPEKGEAPAPVRQRPPEVEPQVGPPVTPIHGRDCAASYCALKGTSAGRRS